MLPDIHLDQITFEEMLEQARNKIAGCYPEWTDFNYHDPGITLIELFAWLKEIQQYGLDHVGDAHRMSCLHLLGADVRHRQGADAFVCVQTKQARTVPAGTRFLASGIVFETEDPQELPGIPVASCLALSPGGERLGYLDSEQMAMGNQVSFRPFGRLAEPGTCLYIRCGGPLPVKKELRLTVRVNEGRQRSRNPAGADTRPLAAYSLSSRSRSGIQRVKLLEDGTFGFLFDGQIRFLLEEEMEPWEVDQEEGYFLRFRLEESQYELPPAVSFLDLNTLKVKQKETAACWLSAEENGDGTFRAAHALCICGELRVFLQEGEQYREIPAQIQLKDPGSGSVKIRPEGELPSGSRVHVLAGRKEDWYEGHRILGMGHGFPHECFLLDEPCISREELVILVEEPDRPGSFCRWEQRKSFGGSGPEDRHYCVDGMGGRILFGDGFHGMAPEGKILLASCVWVQGREGNIKAHRLCPDPSGPLGDLGADNPWRACGGRDEETVAQAFDRVRRELSSPGNLVTAEDYEQAVYQTPGLRIESCRAIFGDTSGKQTVQLVVKPCSLEKRPGLTKAFIQNIREHLEAGRLLGTRIQVLAPVYIRLLVYLEVVVYPQYQEAEEMIRKAVEEHLFPVKTRFGRTASCSGLYGQVDRLPCVSGIRSLLLEARGGGTEKSPYGDIRFPCNGIADEIEVQCSCSFARE